MIKTLILKITLFIIYFFIFSFFLIEISDKLLLWLVIPINTFGFIILFLLFIVCIKDLANKINK